MLLISLFQIFVPLLLIAVVAFSRKSDILSWATQTLAFGMVLSFMWASARWDISSIYFRHLFPVLFLVSAVIGYRRIRTPESKPSTIQTVLSVGVNIVLIVFMSGFNWFSFRGYSVPTGSVDLGPPLLDSQYVVLHGGASPFSNAHFRVRPQNYALDVVGLNALGTSADLLGDRRALDSYEIFGAKIYSPCAGTVVVAVDEYEDLVPPETDPEHLAGNHILIACEEIEVLLAHMKRNSIVVQTGDTVATGDELGLVGNTGNTSEPHLHIHAERGGSPGVILDGTAVPITFGGRFLVRGDIISKQ